MDLLRQLRRLDQSSADFPDQLTSLLHGRGYKDRVESLEDHDAAWLVEYLHNALNILSPANLTSFRECLRELVAICASRETLPQSYMLSGSLLDPVGWPIASRGACDVYEGFLNDSKVCVTRLRIYSNGKPNKVKHAFCQEAVVWKCLGHPNIVPLLGVTVTPFQFVSVWMPGGELAEYISMHPSVDRLSLVSFYSIALNGVLPRSPGIRCR
jgi:hypothetical protein